MVSPVDLLILGSSRTMTINPASFDLPSSSFNSSVTSANLEDDIALYYLYSQKGWKPKKLLIAVDPWLIYDSSQKELWKMSFSPEYKKAKELFFSERKNYQDDFQYMSGYIEKFAQLLSIDYLKSSLKISFCKKTSMNQSSLIRLLTKSIISPLVICIYLMAHAQPHY